MRKFLRYALIILGLILVILQFFQPDKNQEDPNPVEDMVMAAGVPDELAILIKESCYDCHSNHTRYPWYSKISPVSWFLSGHISDGKEALNFSHWTRLDKVDQIGLLADICDEVESGSMPLKSYTIIHRGAKLSEPEANDICVWTEQQGLRLLRD
jgi:hypothetical protein